MTDAVSAFLLPNLVFTAGILAVLVLRKPVRAQVAGRDVYIGKETLPGWLAPRPQPPKPAPRPPI